MGTTMQAKPINLALQGGGSHGAITWGVLDRLLEDPRLVIHGVSGTSAGAMNAVAMATGMAQGGPEGARAALRRFWRAVGDAARFSPIQRTPWDKLTGNYSLDLSPGYLFAETLSRMFSPYELNPLNFNPLRDILEDQIDFGAVNALPEMDVYVTATNVRTGRPRVFCHGDVTADAVLASACLPQLYPAVEIGGEAYWDGGFSGNPALYPLVAHRTTPDIVVVQINPIFRDALPRTAREIMNRVNEISFNSSLVKELRTIALLQRLATSRGIDLGAYSHTFLHLIHAEPENDDLVASSKLNGEWAYLERLFALGRTWAEDWLVENFERVGVESTLDFEGLFGDNHMPAPPMAPPKAAE
jgi:NTE family protein